MPQRGLLARNPVSPVKHQVKTEITYRNSRNFGLSEAEPDPDASPTARSVSGCLSRTERSGPTSIACSRSYVSAQGRSYYDWPLNESAPKPPHPSDADLILREPLPGRGVACLDRDPGVPGPTLGAAACCGAGSMARVYMPKDSSAGPPGSHHVMPSRRSRPAIAAHRRDL